MKRRNLALAAGIAACASPLVLGVGGAGAATLVGSDLTPTPTIGFAVGNSTAQSVARTGSATPVASPVSGVITAIRVKHGNSGANPGLYGFRVLTGTPPTFTATGPPATLPDFNWPANETAGIDVFTPKQGATPKGIPVSVGARIGLVRFSGTAGHGVQYASTAAPGGNLLGTGTPHNTGTLTYPSPFADHEQTIQFTVEPDADADGFGDETQDKCPGKNGATAGCPPNKKKKKCKKKGKKRSAAAAKKKCKKKK